MYSIVLMNGYIATANEIITVNEVACAYCNKIKAIDNTSCAKDPQESGPSIAQIVDVFVNI